MASTRPRKVLIVEGNPDGHRLSYVSLLASAAEAKGEHAILATSTRAVGSKEWAIHLGRNAPLELSIVGDLTLEGLASRANDLGVDHVVIPDGDRFAYELARGQRWAGKGTLSVLVMREKGQRLFVPGTAAVMTFVKRLFFLAANRRPGVEVRVLKSATWRGFSLLPISRDPVVLKNSEENESSKFLTALDGNYFWFGVVGKIGERKNLPLVAASVAAMKRPDVALLVAGEIDPEVLAQTQEHVKRIRQSGGRVEIMDRLLSDEEMDSVIRNLDCVVLAHSNEGPSGILGKAVMAGTRIVASGAVSLRDDCTHVGIGAKWVKMNERALAAALCSAIESLPPTGKGVASSPEEFTSHLLNPKPRG